METSLPAPKEKIETPQDLVTIGSPKLNNCLHFNKYLLTIANCCIFTFTIWNFCNTCRQLGVRHGRQAIKRHVVPRGTGGWTCVTPTRCPSGILPPDTLNYATFIVLN